MKPYIAILSARFRTMLQYRAAAIAGLWTQFFFGLVFIMIYEAFYASTDRPQPLTFAQVVSYVWLGQALLALLPWNVDTEVRAMVRSGAVAYELVRPVDLYNLWFVRALAWRTAPTVLRSVPMVVVTMLVLPLIGLEEWRLAPPGLGNGSDLAPAIAALPPSLAVGAAFALAMTCTLLLSSALSTLVNITMLWTISADGAWMILTVLVTLLSGMLIPLPLFPDWAQPVLMALPFAGLVDLPYRIYVGDIDLGGVPGVLARQIFWTIALVLLGRWLLAQGLRRVVVQGG
jgi:viologen exporter family transport system permease protein